MRIQIHYPIYCAGPVAIDEAKSLILEYANSNDEDRAKIPWRNHE
jgi:hypothetical protein